MKKSRVTGRKKQAARVAEPLVAPVGPSVAAGEFKARCLALMDEVNARGVSYVITKRGKPVAKLVPVGGESGKARKLRGFGALKGMLKLTGDIISPAEEWPETFDEQNL